MKIILGLFSLFVGLSAAATVDGHDRAYIVVRDIQSDEFFVERVPIIGCYGLAQGPRLAQFTAEYHATSNIGCGDAPIRENINYLTCARVVSAKESKDYLSFSKVVVNISACDAKNDPEFIKVLKTAAKLNFPQQQGEVKLVIQK